MWRSRIQYLLAFSCLYSVVSCLTSTQCDPYVDTAGKAGLNCSHQSLDSVPPSLPTNTEVLLLSFNSIKSVSLSSFKNLSNLHDLDLSNNQIKHLEGDYPLSVEKLDLSSNSLTTIPDFRKLPHLRKLILDDNEISALPDGAFQPLVNLSEFSIKGNLIVHIPDHIFDPLENVQHLTLSANKIKAFPKDALSRLEYLETFNVSNNELRTIPQDFFENNMLLYVFLYNNPWHCECNAVKYLKDWIDDNDGNIYKVVGEPDSETVVCATPTARRGIPIINLPAEQICPSGTTDTAAQMSIGTEIPTTFSTLFLQTSPFPEICAQYTDSAGKVGLNCSHRSHDSVPPSLPTDTEVLLLSFNSIKSVSLSSFKNLSNLHDLDLSNNQIKHLEGDYPLSVEKLDLSSNSLTTIPDFRKLPHLRKLILDDNEISALPDGAFQPLVNLSEFSIKGNLIVHIPDHIFDPLENVQHLTLSANKIKAFPKDALSRLEYLETFNVSNNELRTIPQDFFENNMLLYVFLYNNPWHCECNAVKYLKDWIDDNDGNIYKVVGEPDSETVVCATPTARRGIPIINLPAEQICPSGTTDTAAQMSIGTEIPTTFSTLFLQNSPFPEICAQYTDSAGKVEMNCSHRSHDSVPPSLPTDTEVLMLSFNSIKSVSLSSFKNLSNLHDLDLSNNQIKHLEGDYPLPVEKLDLSSNSLTTIPDFRKLPHLRRLILDDNEISALPDGAFQPLVNLEDFSIKGNIIVHIPDHIFDPLNSLRHLTLSANKMKALPKDALSRLEYLETLDVSNNELRTIPQDFFKQQKLLYVFLYNNPWHCECNAVKYLKDWIDDNDGNIYKVVGEPDSETVVCATPTAWRGTPIINLPAEQICPSGTTDTAAQMSIGTEIPTTFSTLFLQNSPFPEICAQYTDSAGKVGLNCSHRSHDSVPPSLPTDTEVLLLSFNSIKSVSLSSFKNLSNLHDLDLSNNQIKHLEGDYPLSVEKLDLSSNSLTTIPDFRKLPHLRKLILDDNEISALPDGAFQPLVNLEDFSIKGNLIVHIPDHIFDPLENLRYLTLSANNIEEFPKDALSRLEHLETFDVSNNELRTIPQDFFENNTLLYVFLYNNPWHCDCNIQYLSTWIRSNEGKVYSPEGSLDDTVVICSMPPELDGIPLIHVPIGYGCVGTTTVTLSTQAASTATNRNDTFTTGSRRSWALEVLQHLGRNCWLLFTLLCLSICLVLLEISALSIYAIRFYRRFYLPLKRLSQRHWYIRLVRYSLVLPYLQQIYPPPRPGSSLEGEAQTAIATDTAGDAFTSFL
ncbi:slit homolog 3 protein-like isoform X2 [Pristis pectinata]|nr:slit homolog 3 protein-like isoform X2 [Pristis pectinata]